MVNKYRDVIRMTLFGRHDKNLNDATSIYQGYDRYQTTTTGGGVNSLASSSSGTIGFLSSPNVYLSNSTNTNLSPLTGTLSTNVLGPINALTITSGGSGFTSAPTLIVAFGGNPTTTATCTCTAAAGVVNTVTLTNIGANYSSLPTIAWNNGGNANITANILGGYVISFTIVSGGSGFTSVPSIYISGGNGLGATATCTIAGGVINSVTVVNGGNSNYSSAPTVYIYGGGQLSITPTMYYGVNNISFSNNPIGSFQTQPTISYNGGGVINITATMNGGNTSIANFNITNGGYVGCFSSAPTIVLSGASGYTTTTCTLNNGQINTIAVPATNNNFVGTPTVSVLGGGLPSSTAVLNPFNVTMGGNSPYQNIKRLRFDLSQEFQSIKIANGAVLFLEFIRMPALTGLSTCYKNLRVIGAQNITVYDSTQGTTGNPILFTCEAGNTATNYFLSNTEYSRLPVPPNFLNRGYIEFELDTVLTAANNSTVYTAAQLNDLIIKVVIAEPDLTQTQDHNLAPEYNKTDFQYGRIYNKQPLKK